MSTKRTITIQPGQPGQGMDYNVHLPLPYPYHIDADSGDVDHFDPNESWRLVGFQRGSEQRVVLHFDEFVADPQAAVGLHPVFAEARGMFSLAVPITSVTETGGK